MTAGDRGAHPVDELAAAQGRGGLAGADEATGGLVDQPAPAGALQPALTWQQRFYGQVIGGLGGK